MWVNLGNLVLWRSSWNATRQLYKSPTSWRPVRVMATWEALFARAVRGFISGSDLAGSWLWVWKSGTCLVVDFEPQICMQKNNEDNVLAACTGVILWTHKMYSFFIPKWALFCLKFVLFSVLKQKTFLYTFPWVLSVSFITSSLIHCLWSSTRLWTCWYHKFEFRHFRFGRVWLFFGPP